VCQTSKIALLVQRLAAGLEPQGGSYSSESNREG